MDTIFRGLDVLSEMSSPDTKTPLAPASVENDPFRHFPPNNRMLTMATRSLPSSRSESLFTNGTTTPMKFVEISLPKSFLDPPHSFDVV